ncbi:MAG: PKD domain-containing protein, partial [Pseudomonadota bacterium]
MPFSLFLRNLTGRFLILILGASLMAASPLVNAKKDYPGIWSGIYPASTSDNDAGCALCHLTTSGSGYNPYGDDIRTSGAGALDARIVDVEGLDSDSDPTGSDNITEIIANTQPGWAEGDNAPFTGDLDPTTVVNAPPVADAGGPYSGIVDLDVTFDGTASTDSDGVIQSYAWDYGDGFTGSGPMPAHAYAFAGNYTITLTVTDDAGDSDTAITSAEIGLANVPPVASSGGPYTGTIDIPLAFDGSASTDTDGTIVDFAWDFGDGSTGTTATPSHTYTNTGEFAVTLTVTDDAGDTGSDTTTATVGLGNQPPVADPAGPYNGTVGLAVAFDGSGSTDPDGVIDFYDWDFGDGTILMDGGPNPTHTYSAASTYNVTLTVTDNEGVSDSAATTATIVEANQPPVADPAGPYIGTENISVTFDGSASSDPDGTIVSYAWTFGDGGTGTGISPSHTYTTAGSYTVSLTVTDDAGDSDSTTTSANIGVVNVAPIANANGPYSSTVGIDVVFDSTGSSDPDGTIVSYLWDFGDGATGTGPMPAHAYAADGTYTITLSVTDDAGDMGIDQTTATISLANQAPVANANGPYTGTEGIPVSFDATGSTDLDGNILTYEWDFGDGGTGAGTNPSHVYATAGAYDVTLVVTDNEGATGADVTTATIGVGNLPPVAVTGGPYSGTVDIAVDFDGSTSTDPDGTIVAYDWDFGDGTILMDAGANPSHTYTAAGIYNVTLTVTDDSTVSDSSATTATIEVAPNQLPTADAGGPYNGTEGIAVSFDGSASNDPDGSIVSYAWDYGDGSSGTSVNPSHTYAAAGTYAVSLTVTDDAGATASASATATIEATPNLLPTADAGGPYSGTEGIA